MYGSYLPTWIGWLFRLNGFHVDKPIGSVYGIFTYIDHILPLKATKCR